MEWKQVQNKNIIYELRTSKGVLLATLAFNKTYKYYSYWIYGENTFSGEDLILAEKRLEDLRKKPGTLILLWN